MNPCKDERLVAEFAARCEEARASLRKHMLELGLRDEDGWRIYEFTRDVGGYTELVMRPMHSRLQAPSDLECSCAIDERGSNISAGCL